MWWVRRFGSVLILLIGFGAIAFYVFASGVVNAQPPTQPFDGWVALLQRADQPFPEQLELRVHSIEPGAPGDHPNLIYSVVACGERAFRGVLLIGGHARLDDLAIVGPAPSDRPRIHELPNTRLKQGSTSWELGPAQLIPVTIDTLIPCASEPGDGVVSGTGYRVTGRARAAVQRSAAFLGTNTPRQSLVWPMVGGFPDMPATNRGAFHGGEGLSGLWVVPPVLHQQVSAGSLAGRATVEGAVPPLQDLSQLTWHSDRAIQPAVRLVNVDQMASAQQTLTTSGIGLGIGGSLLAGMLFEWTKTRRVKAPTVSQMEAEPVRSVVPPPCNHGWARDAVIMGVFVLAYLLWRSRRR